MSRNIIRQGALAVVAIGFTVGAPASDLSYSYVDAGWAQSDIDDLHETGDGFFVRGSVGFAESWFVSASYRQVSFDVGDVDVDFDAIDVGIGGHMPLSGSVDGVARLSYIDVSTDVSFVGISFDDSGYGVSAGVRARPAPQFEIEAMLDYTDLDNSGDDTAARLGGRFYFTPAFAIGAEVSHSDEQTDLGLYGRFTF